MSTTKANLQTKINARANGGNNPISTERELWELMRDEFFSPEIHEYSGNSGNSIIGGVFSGIEFDMYFKKLGNNVFVKWKMTNATGSTIGSAASLVTITNTLFKKKTGSSVHLSAMLSSNTGVTNIAYGDTEFTTAGAIKSFVSLPAGSSLIVTGRYTVND